MVTVGEWLNPSSLLYGNVPRRDYHALNNGEDSLLPAQPIGEPYELELQDSSQITESILSDGPSPFESPFESASQVLSSSPLVSSSEVSIATTFTSVPRAPPTRKEKSYTSWTLEHFWVTILDTKWSKNGKPPKNDRLLVCKRCNWSSSDSARHGTTSNLATHLDSQHRIKPGSAMPFAPLTTALDRFVTTPKAKLTVEQALIQWVVQTRQPFTVVEHLAFRAIFEAAEVELPIKTADTLCNRIKNDFYKGRNKLKQDLARSCHTIALSLDAWTSEHQLAIFGVIGHWITPDFERREELLEFTELYGPHSGENMADILLITLQELEIAPKLLTITGDNASNNGTLCDALQTELRKTYDDEDDEFRMKPLMRFHGRKSFIRCLAHIINLICKDVLATLKAGSAKEAKAILDELAAQKDHSFTSTHSTKGAIAKLRLLVLWITRSPPAPPGMEGSLSRKASWL